MDIGKYLSNKKNIIDKALDELLPSVEEYPNLIHKAMRYSIFSGGKRIRPILVIASAEVVGGYTDDIIPIACGIEAIHTYSLIHDDLPSLDNDDYRRGKLSNHKKFGEETAILAGDALLTFAFEIFSRSDNIAPANDILQMVHEVAKYCGTRGMIGGQMVDLKSEGKIIDAKTLNFIHNNKTGALIVASVRTGAICSGASSEQLYLLTKYAKKLGLLFQIADDLLDLKGDFKKIGKPTGSDLKNKKATYPSLYGIEKTKNIANSLSDEIKQISQGLGQKGLFFSLLPDYLLTREQ